MADHADDMMEMFFVYRGGRAPQHVTHVLIDKSIDEIEEEAFYRCRRLLQVETHDGIRKVGRRAFGYCTFLPKINLESVVEICAEAFYRCENLESVKFGDELETINARAFAYCTSLEHLKLPSIITIEFAAFEDCSALTDIELSERLETIASCAFQVCERLRRIAIPMKRDLIAIDVYAPGYIQFIKCEQLVTVDLVGGIHKTVASLHMESWRTDMLAEINHINQVLPNLDAVDKSQAIPQWMESVLDKMDHYKAKHNRYVKEGISLLELALWKAKLSEKEESSEEEKSKKKVKLDAESARKERRITCGADIVIKNVLPFLQLE